MSRRFVRGMCRRKKWDLWGIKPQKDTRFQWCRNGRVTFFTSADPSSLTVDGVVLWRCVRSSFSVVWTLKEFPESRKGLVPEIKCGSRRGCVSVCI